MSIFKCMTLKEDLKKRAVAFKGSKCILCGYHRCVAGLHFHHFNPHEKSCSISECTSWRQIKEELSKCVLVCANCHAEIHAGLVDLEILVELEYS